jgi:hypothetical protein
LNIGFQSPYTNTFRLNDFTNNAVAIRTSKGFTTATDIAGDVGNYWGLPCPGFAPATVRFENGAINASVFDGTLRQPVAQSSGNKVPKPCK